MNIIRSPLVLASALILLLAGLRCGTPVAGLTSVYPQYHADPRFINNPHNHGAVHAQDPAFGSHYPWCLSADKTPVTHAQYKRHTDNPFLEEWIRTRTINPPAPPPPGARYPWVTSWDNTPITYAQYMRLLENLFIERGIRTKTTHPPAAPPPPASPPPPVARYPWQ